MRFAVARQLGTGVTTLFLLTCITLAADDVVELKTGATLRGKVISQNDRWVTLEVEVNQRKYQRRYARSRIKAITVDGESRVMEGSGDSEAGASAAGTRSKREVLALIDAEGPSPPAWFESTQLDFPSTLDLSWPEPAPQPWDSSRNVGQFIWDRVNPNPSQWRNGVLLMHHIMRTNQGDRRVSNQAMRSLGTMYHNLHEDYARAAYWWQQAGLDRAPDSYPHAGVQLANCYMQLGSKAMALDLLKRMNRYPLTVIKLLGDLGQTEEALKMAERYAQGNNTVVSLLYAGDVCRVAGKLDEAERYYRRAVDASARDGRNEVHAQRDRQRAEASLAAIRFYRLRPDQLRDGTYTASSYGYEDEVQVEVVVAGGRIESVRVTRHREKQFYSSIADTPKRILARQGVLNLDTTSGATITSEAIINATAQALAQGLK